MKKIAVLIFVFGFLLLANNALAAEVGEPCCWDDECNGDDLECFDADCTFGEPEEPHLKGICRPKNGISPAPSGTGAGGTGGTGGTGGMASSQMSECIKLRAEVKIKESASQTTTYTKDLVIAPRELSVAECSKYGAVGSKCSVGSSNSSPCYTSDFGIIIVLGYLNFITAWLFYILMLVSTIFIIYGGFLVVTAAGDPEKANKGKKVVMFAAIGFAVALLARLIPSLVRFVVGV